MLFGKKDSVETIDIYQLENLLDKILTERLKSLNVNGEKIKLDIEQYIKKFKEHCSHFEVHDFEPNTDNLYMPNTKAIKSQKMAYSKALNNILDMQISMNGTNIYENYMGLLDSTNTLKNKILELNASYKQMLFCFAAHTKEFKKNLLGIDSAIHSLDLELSKNSDNYSRYNAIKSLILKIYELDNSYKDISEIINSKTNETKSLKIENNHKIMQVQLKEKIDLDIKNLDKLKNTIAESKQIFLSNFQHIEKLSRKFDHINNNRPNLNFYISDPLSNINKDNYSDFIRIISLLKDDILSKKIDVRNLNDAIMQIDTLLKLDILGTMEEITALILNEKTLSDNISTNKKEYGAIENIDKKIEADINNKAKLQETFNETNESMTRTATAIESAFFETYKKRIKIILH